MNQANTTGQGKGAAGKSKPRKWIWVVLALLLVGIPTCILVPMSLLKSSEPFTQSLERVRQNGEVVRRLGEPIQPGMFVGGSISTSGTGGEGSLSYTVKGPKGKGQVSVQAAKQDGQWQLNRVKVEAGEGEPVSVVPSEAVTP